jgi:SagB-type dehydrogenase family enzyme
MTDAARFFRWTELDATSFPFFREGIAQSDAAPPPMEPRRYPGYPQWPLKKLRARRLTALDRTLQRRRSVRQLGTAAFSLNDLSRLLLFAHGLTATGGRGPTPSAGGLQALELYLVHLQTSWLPAGVYHYDRAGHYLAQVREGATREDWQERIPAMSLVEGGGLLWLLVGDAARTTAKYGDRGYRFLLMEAGHLMQNLCLLSASLGGATVPLGGFFEQAIARELRLPETDVVLYVGIAGK